MHVLQKHTYSEKGKDFLEGNSDCLARRVINIKCIKKSKQEVEGKEDTKSQESEKQHEQSLDWLSRD